LIRVSDPLEAFSLLKEGKADYFIYSLWAGRKAIADNNLTGFKESSIVYSQPFYMGISKNSTLSCHMDEINSSLQRLIDSGDINSMLIKAADVVDVPKEMIIA
jgi:hypothetical protein